ncbi:AAA family ATPase [Fodinisporobacter ferrooxydans]|uniref:AAA family ATPase n=1 Tax=Fodinisporobacter ferrooxydans TaxID=2901836 RepID=A0ABY4CI03_9BACL|nr:AAA family ATPase [Alicyclobacillaceae bacterium MYW30-H2]
MPFANDMLQSYSRQSETLESNTTAVERSVAPTKVVTRFTYDIEKVMQLLRNRIVGQEEALNSIHSMLSFIRADIADSSRPLFVCLFLGPTGVGKTEIVRLLAEAINGNRESFCRVDMNTLSQEHYAASLTGSPPGYVGSKEGITILDKEKIEGMFSSPGIVLFDEIEKASSTVLQTLLNVFDNGMMTVASGQQTINFRNCIIVMTSNLAAREIQEYAKQKLKSQWYRLFGSSNSLSTKKTREIIDSELEKTFSPEFLNRIDEIVTFNWIDKVHLRDIISLEMRQLNLRLRKHRCEIHLDDSIVNFLLHTGYDKRYGARSLKRCIRKHVEMPLADFLLSGSWRNWHDGEISNSKLIVCYRDSKTLFLNEPVTAR